MITLKLDFDIVRKLLLYIEENVYRNNFLMLSSYNNDTEEEIYAAIKLHEAGFIDAHINKFIDGNIRIIVRSITWNGHEFLDNIRPETSWKKTKNIAQKIGGASLNILSDISAKVTADIIKSQL